MSMKKLLSVVVLALAAAAVIALNTGSTVQAAGGGCNCPKGQVCCLDCQGQPAFCARSHAFCPECPAP
jgi:hypothetical protein